MGECQKNEEPEALGEFIRKPSYLIILMHWQEVQQLQVGSKWRIFMTAIRFMKLLTQPRLLCAIIPYIFFQYWW